MEFSEKLLKFRAKYNLSQRKLALLFGVTLYMIHRYEKGVSKPSAVNKIKFEDIMKEMEEKESE